MTAYRSAELHQLCVVCRAPTAGAACRRCDGPLCASHAPGAADQRCPACERSYAISRRAVELQEAVRAAPPRKGSNLGAIAGTVASISLARAIGAAALIPLAFAVLAFVAVDTAIRRRDTPLRLARRRFLRERHIREQRIDPDAALAATDVTNDPTSDSRE